MWRAIVNFIHEHGFSPTAAELQVATGSVTRSAVWSMLHTLEAKKVIAITPGVERGIWLVGLEQEQRRRGNEHVLRQLDQLIKQAHTLALEVSRIRETFLSLGSLAFESEHKEPGGAAEDQSPAEQLAPRTSRSRGSNLIQRKGR